MRARPIGHPTEGRSSAGLSQTKAAVRHPASPVWCRMVRERRSLPRNVRKLPISMRNNSRKGLRVYFSRLAACIVPGRCLACFWGYSGEQGITHTFGVFGHQGHQRSNTSGRPSKSRMEFMMECTPPLGTRTGCMTWRSGTAFTSTFAGTVSSTTMAWDRQMVWQQRHFTQSAA